MGILSKTDSESRSGGQRISFQESCGNWRVCLLTLPISFREMDKGGAKAARCDPELPEAESLYHPLGATAVRTGKSEWTCADLETPSHRGTTYASWA